LLTNFFKVGNNRKHWEKISIVWLPSSSVTMNMVPMTSGRHSEQPFVKNKKKTFIITTTVVAEK
jgi:hypothetical protein